jgi:hypothetical protein
MIDESPLIRFRKLTRRMANGNVQTKSERMDIIKRTKWKEINMKRVRLKIKKFFESFFNNFGKKFMSNYHLEGIELGSFMIHCYL